jgi:lipoprotein-anchoring transpeptidase ErfK/SrfK
MTESADMFSMPDVTFRRRAILTACAIGVAVSCLGVAGQTSSAMAAGTPLAAAKPTTTMATATTVVSNDKTIAPKDLVIPPAPVTGVVSTKTLVAAALGRYVKVFDSPTAAKPAMTFDNRKNFSGRHVFIVIGKQDGGWLKVLVPARPNGRTGWVNVREVGVFEHDYALVVSLSSKTLTLYRAGQVVQTETVAVGQPKYPTPTGVFFTRELARPANPKGAYGPYAFGLSAYSNVLTKFGRGDGQVGIHGTNQPGALGTAASHGCIRVNNDGITKMAKLLPQGVPVDIRA